MAIASNLPELLETRPASGFSMHEAVVGEMALQLEIPIEQQIRNAIARADELRAQGSYAAALQTYLEAWALFPLLVEPHFDPDRPTTTKQQRTLHSLLGSAMIGASVGLLEARALEIRDALPFLDVAVPRAAAQLLARQRKPMTPDERAARDLRSAGHALALGRPQRSEALLRRVTRQTKDPELLASVATTRALAVAKTRDAAAATGRLERLARAPSAPMAARPPRSAALAAMKHATRPAMKIPLDPKGAAVVTVPLDPKARPSSAIVGGSRPAQIPFGAAGASALERSVYQARVAQRDPGLLFDFGSLDGAGLIASLPHLEGFVVPLAIADMYVQVGDFEQAVEFFRQVRDYEYLNRWLEAPALWSRLAEAHLLLARKRLDADELAPARKAITKVVTLQGEQRVAAGELYVGPFAELRAPCNAFLARANPSQYADLPSSIQAILSEASAVLDLIVLGLNPRKLPEGYTPIHRFRYLQSVARYLAEGALSAERAVLGFRQQAERGSFELASLEDALAQAEAAVALAKADEEVAQAQVEVNQEVLDQAELRVSNLEATRDDMELNISALLTYELTLNLLSGSSQAASIGTTAQARSTLLHTLEVAKVERTIAELEAGVDVVEEQLAVANAAAAIAAQRVDFAELREQQARDRLEAFSEAQFGPDVWAALAEQMAHQARDYLDWAIAAALRMQRAFVLEFDRSVDRIRTNYAIGSPSQLGSAQLVRDIDGFTYDELRLAEKRVRIKDTISLRERNPWAFHALLRGGVTHFETALEELDRRHPGAHLRRLRAVELVVDGLMAGAGVDGTLRSSGVHSYRRRDGSVAQRHTRPETMVLSEHQLRADFGIWADEGQVLDVFEGTPPATQWTLAIPFDDNDVDPTNVVDVRLILHYDALHSESVAASVRAAIGDEARERALAFNLRHEYPEALFELRQTGRCELDWSLAPIPTRHRRRAPTLDQLRLHVGGSEGALEGLQLSVSTSEGQAGAEVTDETGLTRAYATLEDASLTGTWQLELTAGERAELRDLVVYIEYRYGG